MKLPFDIVTLLTLVAVIVILFVLFKVFKLLTRIVLIAVFLGIAFLTNPKEEKHQWAAQEKARVEQITLKPERIKIKDLKVASLTLYEHPDGDYKTIGVGMFTKVFIFRNPE